MRPTRTRVTGTKMPGTGMKILGTATRDTRDMQRRVTRRKHTGMTTTTPLLLLPQSHRVHVHVARRSVVLHAAVVAPQEEHPEDSLHEEDEVDQEELREEGQEDSPVVVQEEPRVVLPGALQGVGGKVVPMKLRLKLNKHSLVQFDVTIH